MKLIIPLLFDASSGVFAAKKGEELRKVGKLYVEEYSNYLAAVEIGQTILYEGVT
jgi:hypothetical protein